MYSSIVLMKCACQFLVVFIYWCTFNVVSMSYEQIIWWRIFWGILSTKSKSHICCTGMLLKKLMEYGFTIHMIVKLLQVFSTGINYYHLWSNSLSCKLFWKKNEAKHVFHFLFVNFCLCEISKSLVLLANENDTLSMVYWPKL